MARFQCRVLGIVVSLWIISNYGTVRGDDNEVSGVAPKFTSPSQHFRVILGNNVQLPCHVDHLGPYVLLWKRGPSVLTAASMMISQDKRLDLVNGFDLEIKSVRPQDAGEYVCQVSTFTPQEQTHTLEILVPPTVRSDSSYVEGSKGESVTIKCEASGNPTPKITWTRLNNLLPNGEPSFTGTEFTIRHADRHQAGIYLCSGDNGVGAPQSSQVEVKVEYPPEIEVERGWIHTGENQEAILACIVHADPPAQKVKWFRESGMLVDTDGRRLMEQRGSRHALIIRKIQTHDFGNYSCEASNKLGRAVKSIELSGKPNRAIFRSDPVGRSGHSFNITWTVESYSPIDEYRLSYRKKHVNESHSEFPGPWLDVVLPAIPGETSNFYEKTGTTPPAGSRNVIHWKSYHLRNLDTAVIYEAKVTARNKYGWGQLSDLFQFNTQSLAHQFLYESSPQRDGLVEPEARDMRITLPNRGTPTKQHATFYAWPLFLVTILLSQSLR